MSSDNQKSGGEVHIDDEEGLVDRKTKQQILNLRAQVDDDERTLYVDKMSDPQTQLSVQQANEYWGISVRQYLRGIKRLWNDHNDNLDIRNVTYYWEDVEIGSETLIPPDTQDYQFSIVAHADDHTDAELKQYLGLPHSADLPQPQTVTFDGLISVLNTSRLSHQWTVTTDASGPPAVQHSETLRVDAPVPKHILENAVEAADNFLQQAGIGFEVAVPDYHGGAEPGL